MYIYLCPPPLPPHPMHAHTQIPSAPPIPRHAFPPFVPSVCSLALMMHVPPKKHIPAFLKKQKKIPANNPHDALSGYQTIFEVDPRMDQVALRIYALYAVYALYALYALYAPCTLHIRRYSKWILAWIKWR